MKLSHQVRPLDMQQLCMFRQYSEISNHLSYTTTKVYLDSTCYTTDEFGFKG